MGSIPGLGTKNSFPPKMWIVEILPLILQIDLKKAETHENSSKFGQMAFFLFFTFSNLIHIHLCS